MARAIEFLRQNGICAYCGEYGDEVEHVVPRWTGLPTYTLLACRECNGIAGGKLFKSFEARKGYIQAKLRKRYAKILRMPEWDETELKEMGYAMRVQIRAYEDARRIMERRVSWTWISDTWIGD